ncbi:hypothetical protein AB0M47_23365 [Hamadaea sp. NPDC051192]|uniref:hypothetical protein n=1 Tax=Hamadaea sp. NPDC051192 TaxID=3154940 RepID=UPI003414F449
MAGSGTGGRGRQRTDGSGPRQSACPADRAVVPACFAVVFVFVAAVFVFVAAVFVGR